MENLICGIILCVFVVVAPLLFEELGKWIQRK